MTKRKTTSTSKRYRILRELLEDRRAEIHQKLRSLRESLPAEVSEVRDAEEQSLDDFVHEVDFALMQMKSDTLSKIDEAIHRLERGAYGVCVACSGDIAAARLKALPFADLCRECQEQEEVRDVRERGGEPRPLRELTPQLL